jgi:hypothetical protein
MSKPKAVDRDGSNWAFGSGGFCKLYGNRLAQSSLLDRDVATRWVFVFMLSQADAAGRFRCASVTNLARVAAVTPEQAQAAVSELEAPDPDSTSKDEQGRRIVRIAGGWQIVTYQRYREFRTPRQIAAAERKRRQRKRDTSVTSRPVTQQRTEERMSSVPTDAAPAAAPPSSSPVPAPSVAVGEALTPAQPRGARPAHQRTKKAAMGNPLGKSCTVDGCRRPTVGPDASVCHKHAFPDAGAEG